MKYFLSLIMVLAFGICLAQEAQNGKIVVVDLKDGSTIIGTWSGQTNEYVLVESVSLSLVKIPVEEIDKIKYISESSFDLDSRGYTIDYHNSTRYFITPSGYGLQEGQSYYENIWIFFNSYAYGVTDVFSISFSAELASVLFSSNLPLMFVNAKFSFPVADNFAVAGNLSYLNFPEDEFSGFIFATLSSTFGSRNNNFTLGTGGGYRLENGPTDEVIPVTLSGMFRLGPKLSFVSENWIILENDLGDATSIISAGVRVHFKNPGSAVNAALVRPLGENLGDFIAFPFVSATVGL